MAGYVVVHNRVHDRKRMQEYLVRVGDTLAPFGAEVLATDERSQVVEGDLQLPRTVIIRFPTREEAVRWYESEAYRAILPLRREATAGFVVIAEGTA